MRFSREFLEKLSNSEKMQEVYENIMKKSTVRDGKIYAPSGKKIGWIKTIRMESGLVGAYGWLNHKGYEELKNNPEFCERLTTGPYEDYFRSQVIKYAQANDKYTSELEEMTVLELVGFMHKIEPYKCCDLLFWIQSLELSEAQIFALGIDCKPEDYYKYDECDFTEFFPVEEVYAPKYAGEPRYYKVRIIRELETTAYIKAYNQAHALDAAQDMEIDGSLQGLYEDGNFHISHCNEVDKEDIPNYFIINEAEGIKPEDDIDI